jgi:hypothetical protein
MSLLVTVALCETSASVTPGAANKRLLVLLPADNELSTQSGCPYCWDATRLIWKGEFIRSSVGSSAPTGLAGVGCWVTTSNSPRCRSPRSDWHGVGPC